MNKVSQNIDPKSFLYIWISLKKGFQKLISIEPCPLEKGTIFFTNNKDSDKDKDSMFLCESIQYATHQVTNSLSSIIQESVDRAPDQVHIGISKLLISKPNPML